MSFDVSADAYLRFMGRYSESLAALFADLAGIRRGQRVLDVGCGPGALTAELVSRAGADAVSAVEPSASFAAAVRERLPGVDVRQAAAEQLPFPDAVFDAAMAQLVVHFMADPVGQLLQKGKQTEVSRLSGVPGSAAVLAARIAPVSSSMALSFCGLSGLGAALEIIADTYPPESGGVSVRNNLADLWSHPKYG